MTARVLSLSPYRECVMCRRSRLLSDLAKFNDDSYCHGCFDGSPTCYEKAQMPLDEAQRRGWL